MTRYSGVLALALVACGGEFQAAGRGDDDGGTDGLAGAAGDVDPGSGGTAGTAGSAAGGSAGAGSGGSVTTGGAGGGDAGEAGAPTAGNPAGGAAGTAGEPSGGSAGTGGSAPSCTQSQAITPAAIPQSFTWDGFSARFDDVDASYCASSDGATCQLRNVSVRFDSELPLVTISFYLTCQPAFRAGVCGSEQPCPSSFDETASVTARHTVEPAGNGYVLTGGDGYATPRLSNETACWSPSANPSNDSRLDFAADFVAWLNALSFPCPA